MIRVLVIEDDANILAILAEMLSDAGYEVVQARDGKEGIKLYRQAPVDLVITDLIMPEKDGLEVVMELRKDFPEVKIITLSGGGSHGHYHHAAARAFGAARSLQKPFRNDELLDVVRDVLDAKPA